LVERGVILSGPGEPIDVHHLFPMLPERPAASINAQGRLERAAPSEESSLYDEVIRRGLTLDGLEDTLLREAVERTGGNLAAAGRALGLTSPQIRYRMSRLKERSSE
jgi:transcriptional regulator with GAF, ATPase, and Fis domain